MLFSPINLGGIQLKNRVVMASMHTGLEDIPFSAHRLIRFYEERIHGGVGMIITGGVSPNFRGRVHLLGSQLSYRWQIRKHRQVTRAVHAAQGKICLQILHAGRYAFHPWPIAPSRIQAPINKFIPKEASLSDIQNTIRDFAVTAQLAEDAGYDGVEIMGSEGYFLHQFFSAHTNLRLDAYSGAELATRVRLPLEVVEAVRKRVSKNFGILYRVPILDLIPENGSDPEDVGELVRGLEEVGADAFTSGIGWHESRIPTILTRVPRGAFKDSVALLKRFSTKPVLGTNRIPTAEVAEKWLSEGVCDAVAIGRPLLADPEWVEKSRTKSAPVAPCIACNQSCLDAIFTGKIASCLVNPRAGYETKIQMKRAKEPKKLLVIGGGVSGMAFSVFAAQRGHHVRLLEKDTSLGGQLNLAKIVPGKAEFYELLEYYQNQFKRLQIGTKLGFPVAWNENFAKEAQGFDAIVIASGVQPKSGPKHLVQDKRTVSYAQLLSFQVEAKSKVAILGAGGVAVDTAEFLLSNKDVGEDPNAFAMHWGIDPTARGGLIASGRKLLFQSREVYLLSRSQQSFGKNLGKTSGWVHRAELKQAGLRYFSGVESLEWKENGLQVSVKSEKDQAVTQRLLPVEQLVLCVGSETTPMSRDFSEENAQKLGIKVPVFKIGGALSDQKLDAARAIREAALLADKIEAKLFL